MRQTKIGHSVLSSKNLPLGQFVNLFPDSFGDYTRLMLMQNSQYSIMKGSHYKFRSLGKSLFLGDKMQSLPVNTLEKGMTVKFQTLSEFIARRKKCVQIVEQITRTQMNRESECHRGLYMSDIQGLRCANLRNFYDSTSEPGWYASMGTLCTCIYHV